jgi:HPr kinase/phosphorylase
MTMASNIHPPGLHATAVAINGQGVAMVGQSGAGKSDLALRLIDRGAVLICDDRVELHERDHDLWARSIPSIAGKIEIRGVGIVDTPHIGEAPLRLIVDVGQSPERYPDVNATCDIACFAVPELRIRAFEASAAIKVELALRSLLDRNAVPVRKAPA